LSLVIVSQLKWRIVGRMASSGKRGRGAECGLAAIDCGFGVFDEATHRAAIKRQLFGAVVAVLVAHDLLVWPPRRIGAALSVVRQQLRGQPPSTRRCRSRHEGLAVGVGGFGGRPTDLPHARVKRIPQDRLQHRVDDKAATESD